MSNEYLVNSDDMTSVADAIREKRGTSQTLMFPAEFVHAIQTIQTGGGGTIIPATIPKDVNFYDYDGTLLYAYTLEEAQALAALPDGPAHEGLVFDGWNYSLKSVKSLTRAMNIGAMYSTNDETTRIYIHLKDGRTSPMLGICPNGTVTVDWGDGTKPNTLTGTSLTGVKWTPTHNYASPGDYVIKLTVDGQAQLHGISRENAYSYILRYASSADSRNRAYQSSILKVEIGAGIRIGYNAFSYCYSLSSITIPFSVTSIGTNAFYSCYSLSSITIPDSAASIESYTFQSCRSLSIITIPSSVTSIGSSAFSGCNLLSSITIPGSITSIGSYAFNGCCLLSSITIPGSITSIGDDAFSYCNLLSSITIPSSVKSIGTNAFCGCFLLSSITIPSGVTSIGGSAFYGCYGMVYYDFTALSAVPTLSNTNAFKGIAADCEIRVPATLAEEWKAATNWATYADHIVGV